MLMKSRLHPVRRLTSLSHSTDNGNYDPIWEINDELEVLNAQKGWQVVSTILNHWLNCSVRVPLEYTG